MSFIMDPIALDLLRQWKLKAPAEKFVGTIAMLFSLLFFIFL
jgi:hypothetical protein